MSTTVGGDTMYTYTVTYSSENGSISERDGIVYYPDIEVILDNLPDNIRTGWNEIIIIDQSEGDCHSTYEREGPDEYDYTCTYRYI